MVILQTLYVVGDSDKATNYCFLHPRTHRHCFAWMPNSQVEQLRFGSIRIPDWLWTNIKKKL